MTVSYSSDSNMRVGAASVDVTPSRPAFLYGYPKVPRTHTGVNDPLMASALYLDDGKEQCLLVAVDLIWLSKRQVAIARARIHGQVGVPIVIRPLATVSR